ncbi:MAG TPA: gephyrin-like molybdotransferase Glp [Roseiflexaceae bacterium]|nr:gephyrin-like molybdotransferase Glp [Roseiflexaceae bacterium]
MLDISVEAALERILAGCSPCEAIEIPAEDAAGQVLAEDVLAPHALPPFTNSGMDGFAVRVADLATASQTQPVALPAIGMSQAGGAPAPAVVPGTTVRVMTGAPLPEGAEAVVPIENVEEAANNHVRFFEPTKRGRHVRPAGEDVAAGQPAIPAGKLARPAEVGLLAALGIERVKVVRRPRIAIVSTGDELLRPGEPLAPGRIRDANGPALAAFVTEQGAVPLPLGIARDTHDELRAKIDAAREAKADLIITSAGASAGDFDIVRGLLAEEDALDVWRVNIKPGRPLLYGRVGGIPLIGLPGNPAAALIVAELVVRPAIERMRGLPPLHRHTVQATLDAPQRGSERRHYIRALVQWQDGSYRAITRGIGAGSGALTTLVRSNALLVIPEDTTELPTGSLVEAILL